MSTARRAPALRAPTASWPDDASRPAPFAACASYFPRAVLAAAAAVAYDCYEIGPDGRPRNATDRRGLTPGAYLLAGLGDPDPDPAPPAAALAARVAPPDPVGYASCLVALHAFTRAWDGGRIGDLAAAWGL